MTKKLDIISVSACAAAIIGFILRLVSYRTYPAAAVNSTVGTLCGCMSIVLLAAVAVKVCDERLRGHLILCAGILLVIFIYQFVMGRVAIAADVYFIPVNHPEEENAAMNLSIYGLIAAVIAFAAVTVDAFLVKGEAGGQE